MPRKARRVTADQAALLAHFACFQRDHEIWSRLQARVFGLVFKPLDVTRLFPRRDRGFGRYNEAIAMRAFELLLDGTPRSPDAIARALDVDYRSLSVAVALAVSEGGLLEYKGRLGPGSFVPRKGTRLMLAPMQAPRACCLVPLRAHVRRMAAAEYCAVHPPTREGLLRYLQLLDGMLLGSGVLLPSNTTRHCVVDEPGRER